MESLDHFFFSCSLSSFVWQEFLRRLSLHCPTSNWNSLVEWAAEKWKIKSRKHFLAKMCLGTTIYCIWKIDAQKKFFSPMLSVGQQPTKRKELTYFQEWVQAQRRGTSWNLHAYETPHSSKVEEWPELASTCSGIDLRLKDLVLMMRLFSVHWCSALSDLL